MNTSGAAIAARAPEPVQPSDAPAAELELTILMPCLNEAETIEVCIRKAQGFLARSGIAGEVLIADNGSTDGSIEIAERLGARVERIPTRGYGAALIGGINAARGKYTIMGDADDSYDFVNLEGFVEKLRGGSDLVMGNRFLGGIEPGAMPPLHRYFGNPVLSFIGRLLFNLPIGDFHCGLRGFNTESMRKLKLVASGMEFASEMVLRSGLAKLSLTEVPTTLKPDGRSRPPHLKSFRDGWRHVKLLLMYNPRWLFLYPGVLLFGLGAALAGLLLLAPFRLGGGPELDINTFVTACFMMISGVQVISFGVLARFYATLTGMLPRGGASDWVSKHVTTDTVVRVAFALLAVGLVALGFAVWEWLKTGFGPLDNPLVPRVVVGGLSLIVIAIQLGFQAFIIGILQIPLTRR